MNTRDILITGGAGFIGSHLARQLSMDDTNVLVTDDCSAGNELLVPEGVQFEQADIRSDDFRDLVRRFDPDGIVHLAAIHYIPYCNANPEETFQVNVMGTRNLLTVARELSGLETVVFGSSAAVYPPREKANTETSESGPMDIYGETKLIGEDLMKLFHQETGVATTVARLFNVYGPNETNEHLIPAVLKQIRTGDRTIELGNLTPKRDFVHVTDVARALETLVMNANPDYATYNVGTGSPHSVREVVDRTAEALGEKIEIVQDDDRVRESDRPHLEADVSAIQIDHDWTPEVSFVDGLQELIEQDDDVLVK